MAWISGARLGKNLAQTRPNKLKIETKWKVVGLRKIFGRRFLPDKTTPYSSELPRYELSSKSMSSIGGIVGTKGCPRKISPFK